MLSQSGFLSQSQLSLQKQIRFLGWFMRGSWPYTPAYNTQVKRWRKRWHASFFLCTGLSVGFTWFAIDSVLCWQADWAFRALRFGRASCWGLCDDYFFPSTLFSRHKNHSQIEAGFADHRVCVSAEVLLKREGNSAILMLLWEISFGAEIVQISGNGWMDALLFCFLFLKESWMLCGITQSACGRRWGCVYFQLHHLNLRGRFLTTLCVPVACSCLHSSAPLPFLFHRHLLFTCQNEAEGSWSQAANVCWLVPCWQGWGTKLFLHVFLALTTGTL